jgi:hypothetical protein
MATTITYSLAPEPIWYLVNQDGTPSGGASLFTTHSSNKDANFDTFVDNGGAEKWPNPIVFDLNGTHKPIYFQFDSANPTDTYFLRAVDAQGNELWTVDNFTPGAGGGGGGTTTNYISIKNYIANNQFINHIADLPTMLPVNLVIAPSNHKGFTPALVNPVIGTYGALGPDIRFVKNNTTAADSIEFPTFPLASAPLIPDNTPSEYVHYVSGAGSGETYKNFQFPITQKVKNLSQQPMTFSIWAAVTATPVNLSIYARQYYGSGTAATVESTSTRPLIGTCALTTTWTRFLINFTIANVSGNSLGTPGLQTNDDALYIQVEMPLNAACDVLFTKPCLFLGTVNPAVEFDSYDEIDSIDSTARCGDVKTSLLSSPPAGWLAMNDTTIGNTGSGATTAGAFTFQLYKTIWDGIDNAWAPVSTVSRGASAIADFLAGVTIKMPRSLGRALAGAGAGAGLTSRALGQYLGSEVITIAAMPLHNHPGSTVNLAVGNQGTNPTGFNTSANNNSSPLIIAPQGGGILNVQGAADGNMEPTSYFNVFIKL